MKNIIFIAAHDIRHQLRQSSTLLWLLVMPPIFFLIGNAIYAILFTIELLPRWKLGKQTLLVGYGAVRYESHVCTFENVSVLFKTVCLRLHGVFGLVVAFLSLHFRES